MGNDANKLKEAIAVNNKLPKDDKLMAVVIPHEGLSPAQAKSLLINSGLWYLK